MLVNVIDGIDEASDWIAGRDVAIPGYAEKRVKVLISCRPLAGDNGANGWLDRLNWRGKARIFEMGLLNRKDFTPLFSGAPAWLQKPEIVDVVYKLTEYGDPLLARMLMEQLSDSSPLTPQQLAQEEPGYRGFFKRWWREQEQIWQVRGETELATSKQVRRALAAALGPLDRDLLAQLTGNDAEEIERSTIQLGRLIVGDGRKSGWVFSHPKLRDYFWDEMGASLQEQWSTSFLSSVRKAVALAEEGRLREIPRYCIEFGAAHLIRAKVDYRELQNLASQSWLNAWQILDPVTYAGYERDVAHVREAAERAQDVSLQIKCAATYWMTRANSGIPAVLARLMVEVGIATIGEVLALIKRAEYGPHQAESLQTIIPFLGTQTESSEALSLTETLPAADYKIRVLIDLIPHLSGDIRARAVLDIYDVIKMLVPEQRVEALAAVSQIVELEQASKILEQAFEGLKDLSGKNEVRALVALMHVTKGDNLRKRLFDRALDSASVLDPGDDIDEALLYLLTKAPEDLCSRISTSRSDLFGSPEAHYNDIATGTLNRISLLRIAIPKLKPRDRKRRILLSCFNKLKRRGVRELAAAGTLDIVEPSERILSIEDIEGSLESRSDELSAYTRLELIQRGLDPLGFHFDKVLECLPGYADSVSARLLRRLAMALPAPITREQFEKTFEYARVHRQVIPELCTKVTPEWKRDAVFNTLQLHRRPERLEQLLARLALVLSARLPSSYEPAVRYLLKGFDRFWLFTSTARDFGEFSVPPYVLEEACLTLSQDEDLNPYDVSDLAWITTDLTGRTTLTDALERRVGRIATVLVLRANLSTPERKTELIRQARKAIEESKAKPARDVLRLGAMMTRAAGVEFATRLLLYPKVEGESPAGAMDRIVSVVETFPECCEDARNLLREMGMFKRWALLRLSEVAPEHMQEKLLGEALAAPGDKAQEILLRGRLVRYLTAQSRQSEIVHLLSRWQPLEGEDVCKFAAVIAPLLPIPKCRELILAATDRLIAEAHKGWPISFGKLIAPVSALYAKDISAVHEVARRVLRALIAFNEGSAINHLLDIYPVLVQLSGSGVALDIFDTLLAVRSWWGATDGMSSARTIEHRSLEAKRP